MYLNPRAQDPDPGPRRHPQREHEHERGVKQLAIYISVVRRPADATSIRNLHAGSDSRMQHSLSFAVRRCSLARPRKSGRMQAVLAATVLPTTTLANAFHGCLE
jgi:hypothetical protein